MPKSSSTCQKQCLIGTSASHAHKDAATGHTLREAGMMDTIHDAQKSLDNTLKELIAKYPWQGAQWFSTQLFLSVKGKQCTHSINMANAHRHAEKDAQNMDDKAASEFPKEYSDLLKNLLETGQCYGDHKALPMERQLKIEAILHEEMSREWKPSPIPPHLGQAQLQTNSAFIKKFTDELHAVNFQTGLCGFSMFANGDDMDLMMLKLVTTAGMDTVVQSASGLTLQGIIQAMEGASDKPKFIINFLTGHCSKLAKTANCRVQFQDLKKDAHKLMNLHLAKLNANLTIRYHGYDRWVVVHGYAMKGFPCSFPMVDYSNCKPEELQAIITAFESGECQWEKLTDAEQELYRECADATEAKVITLNPSQNEITRMTVESAPTSTPTQQFNTNQLPRSMNVDVPWPHTGTLPSTGGPPSTNVPWSTSMQILGGQPPSYTPQVPSYVLQQPLYTPQHPWHASPQQQQYYQLEFPSQQLPQWSPHVMKCLSDSGGHLLSYLDKVESTGWEPDGRG
ncbi:hypothetical protein BS47DRAFT_1361369 [Hydnum rufescens UP504]|uniref:Uncharacterized protein n=1 Tax=Hydnum rufescens UP504 TaxID=1448309 RepID=A0A9P6B014_9AGAM|nr:hypothetical protein BS47DRAFT_1361369 [Hydnum rufescens UP504]